MKKKIFILGVTGMLGHVLFKELSKETNFDVFASTRNLNNFTNLFTKDELSRIRTNVDADNFDTVIRAFAAIQPDIVINCIGLIKQLSMAEDPLTTITVNAQFPHRISMLTRNAGARLIHISTDCVFDGKRGSYEDNDQSDAVDLYGKTKYLGEVSYPHCITLRSSIIGHELKSCVSIVDWFLSQSTVVKGYTKAFYSGFTTVEMAKIISKFIIPNEMLNGVYQVSSDVISKYDLIKLISKVYKKNIEIVPFAEFEIDRSLKSDRFKKATGYRPPKWDKQIRQMYEHFLDEQCYQLPT